MYISRLVLDHFRSWDHCVVDFSSGINILQGFNGLGKTNIIEAVEVLSTGSSHRTSSSIPLVERGQSHATIRANVLYDHNVSTVTTGQRFKETNAHHSDPAIVDHESSDITSSKTYEITIQARGTNRARINSGRSLYMRDVIGSVPSVMFAPEDQWLVAGEPSQRRNFLDQAGALLIDGYAGTVQQYERIAKQRAALLRQLNQEDSNATDATLNELEIWTSEFVRAGVAVTKDRRRIVDGLSRVFASTYHTLAGLWHQEENAGLSYRPSFDELLEDDHPEAEISRHLQRIYPGEVARGRNLIGPHRDDLEIELDGMPAREFASNGEVWTLALALKMSLLSMLSACSEERPIVLLDDVFAQLDESRRDTILDFASRQGQVMITVAAASDIPEIVDAHIIDVAGLREVSQDVNVSVVEQVQAARMAARLAPQVDTGEEGSS